MIYFIKEEKKDKNILHFILLYVYAYLTKFNTVSINKLCLKYILILSSKFWHMCYTLLYFLQNIFVVHKLLTSISKT